MNYPGQIRGELAKHGWQICLDPVWVSERLALYTELLSGAGIAVLS
jgi:hypothetical protein